MSQTQAIEYAKEIKNKYEQQLMSLANVVGVGIGIKQTAGNPTGEVALVVNVSKKKPLAELNRQDIIPTILDDVPVDVQEVGHFTAF
jgi:alanine-alpha-ketoisovalerate/valine-pyruvate aminotransferase